MAESALGYLNSSPRYENEEGRRYKGRDRARERQTERGRERERERTCVAVCVCGTFFFGSFASLYSILKPP